MSKIKEDADSLDESDIQVKEVFAYLPFFVKYLDWDQRRNWYLLVAFRIFQAIVLTHNMAHPDEYW